LRGSGQGRNGAVHTTVEMGHISGERECGMQLIVIHNIFVYYLLNFAYYVLKVNICVFYVQGEFG
jgi:hypothetical protein